MCYILFKNIKRGIYWNIEYIFFSCKDHAIGTASRAVTSAQIAQVERVINIYITAHNIVAVLYRAAICNANNNNVPFQRQRFSILLNLLLQVQYYYLLLLIFIIIIVIVTIILRNFNSYRFLFSFSCRLRSYNI